MKEIQDWLLENQDVAYKEFSIKLNPVLSEDRFIGVRTPALRSYAKQLVKNGKVKPFLNELPHTYFEENQLHAFIISEQKQYEEMMGELERFLPYVDNWATCDQLRPKILKKHPEGFLDRIYQWLESSHTYTIRFGIGMLLSYYLDDAFDPKFLERVSLIRSDEYYINMMIAWYFATALAKQYDATIPYIERKKLSPWVHKKTIQKARESYRVKDEHKKYLKQLLK